MDTNGLTASKIPVLDAQPSPKKPPLIGTGVQKGLLSDDHHLKNGSGELAATIVFVAVCAFFLTACLGAAFHIWQIQLADSVADVIKSVFAGI